MIPCNVRVPFGAKSRLPCKGSLSEINTGDPFFYFKNRMDGTREVVFHVNLIDILGRVFLSDGMKFLSREQERFISKFFEAAEHISSANSSDNGTVNELNIDYYTDLGIIGEDYSTDSNGIDSIFIKLDHFLGNYRGVDENEYTR